jgi:hypothetical protein
MRGTISIPAHALMIAASVGALGCMREGAREDARPDFAVAEDSSSRRALVSAREIRIRNQGFAGGEGVASLAVVDSLGNALMEIPVQNGAPINLAAAALGGSEARVVPVAGGPAFENLLTELLRSRIPFGLRARIRTTGGDADEADNVATREWRASIPILPSAEQTITFAFVVPHGLRAARVRVETLIAPQDTPVRNPLSEHGLLMPPGTYAKEIHLTTPSNLRHGSRVLARLTVADSETGEVLQQHERLAVYDTIPPMLSSYRAVLLRDGRVAVQVHAGDRHAGVSENGVSTHYSLDGGHTWQRRLHASVEDDFGRPALFETVLDSLPAGADLLLGICAQDWVGNTNMRLPADASVFQAPINAELILDAFGVASTSGNPLFAPTTVARHASWVAAEAAHARSLALQPLAGLGATERFELRRIEDLQTVPVAFRTAGVNIKGFKHIDARTLRLSADDGLERTVLRIRTESR